MPVEQTYEKFSHKFDLGHAALNGGWSTELAMQMGFIVTVHGEYLKAKYPQYTYAVPKKDKLDPHLNPHGQTQPEIYRYGDQHGRQFDPSHFGYAHGRPNQGYGNWPAGKPHIPEPTWPILAPHIVPPRPDNTPRPHWKPY